MHFLQADYTEVWVPRAVAPLIQFAQKVEAIASTGIDTFGLPGLNPHPGLVARLQSFDEVVSWYGTKRPEFRSALQNAGVRCSFHDALPPDSWAHHATDFFADQVGAPRGLVSRLTFAHAQARQSVVIHPFSGSPRKNWPLVRFQELAAAMGIETEWLAGPNEELPGAIRIEDLAELGRWLTGARLFIGNDSGITHLAASTGVKTIAIFGLTNPQVWCPRGPNVQKVRGQPLEQLEVGAVIRLAICELS